MSFTDNWLESYPAGTTYANELDTAITQGGKRAIRERLCVDHDVRANEAGAEESQIPTDTIGYHKKVTLTDRSSVPTEIVAGGILFTKEVDDISELHYVNNNGDVIQVTKDEELNIPTISELAIEIGKILLPVGSLYGNYSDGTNPATLLGFGTWTAACVGRTLVGIDSTQTEFDIAGEQGGEKTHTMTLDELVAHGHGYTGKSADPSGAGDAGSGWYHFEGGKETEETGGGEPFNILQPYEVYYLWRRTA